VNQQGGSVEAAAAVRAVTGRQRPEEVREEVERRAGEERRAEEERYLRRYLRVQGFGLF
jgi:hypothetical protein